WLQAHEKLLIVVDQFEELFRFSKLERGNRSGKQDSLTFIKLILDAGKQREYPIYVLLTMRSDFIGDCTEFRDLPEALNNGQYLVPRMTRTEKRAAITGPAAVGGAAVSPRLLSRVLNDVGDNPDQLPILQHALRRTWDYWLENQNKDEPLDIRHYEAVGTMKEALSRHAEEAFAELKNEKEQSICEKMFKMLTETGENSRGIRRPTKISEICRVTGTSEKEVIKVIDRFRRPGRTFLMPPAGEALHAGSVIDISHESLMRVWTRLSDWAQEEMKSAGLYRHLAKTAANHEIGRAALFRDPELMLALKWRENNRPNAAWAERYDPAFQRAIDFLDASKKQQELEIAEKEKLQKEKGRTKRIMVISTIVFIACVLSIFLTVWAIKSKDKAEASQAEALVAKKQAEKDKQIALAAEKKAAENAEQARLEKERAEKGEQEAKEQKLIAGENEKKARANQKKAEIEQRKAKKNETIANIQGLIVAMSQAEDRFLQYLAKANELAVYSSALSRDPGLKALLVATAYRMNREAYRNLETAAKKIFAKYKTTGRRGDGDILEKAKALEEKYRRQQKKAGRQRVPAKIFAALREAYLAVTGNEKINKSFSGGPGGRFFKKAPLVAEGKKNNFMLGDILYPGESWVLFSPAPGEVVFNHRQSRLVKAALQPRTTGLPGLAEPVEIAAHTPLHAACLVLGRERIFCGTWEGDLLYWDRSGGSAGKLPFSYGARILAADFSRQSKTLYYSAANRVYSWNFEDKPRPILETAPSCCIRALEVIEAPGNSVLLAADEAGNIYCYRPGSGGGAKKLPWDFPAAAFFGLSYSPGAQLLAATAGDGNVMLFPGVNVNNLSAGKEITPFVLPKIHTGITAAVAFDPGGKYLASAGWDGRIVLWNLVDLNREISASTTGILQQEPLLTFQGKSKIISVVFESGGEYLLFNDGENLRICPTDPAVFYRLLCKTKQRELTRKEWQTYVGDSIEKTPICPGKNKKEIK
ncbi:MAG: hypothetical protein KAW12_13225, partial [Candidatus Aminicenantes bacterium]|nr:hypothetical protein [Candidatus Aminicenantes bacterium]